MAINQVIFSRLVHAGISVEAARVLADPAEDLIATGAAVANAAALTSTDVVAANATSPAAATYTVANQTALADLANESKADLNALRADVTALRTTVNNLLASLRTAGHIAP